MWKETIGEVVDIAFRSSWISYKIDGEVYNERIDGWYTNVVVGEKYIIHYNIEKPKKIRIDFWHPIFEEGESTFFCVGKILKVRTPNWIDKSLGVRYFFKVDGREITKYVKLPVNHKEIYPNLTEGQMYRVQVWTENIYRSVILLDSPILKYKIGDMCDDDYID